jgi:hypothetical protein
VAWLRDRDARPLVRALEGKTPDLADVVAELACREVIPGAAPALRSLLAGRRGPDERVALALGTQGNPADGPRLLALLGQRPRSLDLAVAVARTGHAEAADEARSLWRPPAKVGEEGVVRSRLRELAAPRLARRLRGEVKDLARTVATPGRADAHAAAGELLNLLRALAPLGLPAPDGEPVALLAPYAGEQAFRAECWWYDDEEMNKLQKTWREAKALGERIASLQAGEAAPLAWWQAPGTRGKPRRDYLGPDERFDRVVREIASRPEDPRRGEALGVWLDLGGSPAREELGSVLALLKGDPAELPWASRDKAALFLRQHRSGNEYGWDLTEVLAWLRGRPWGLPDGLLEQDEKLAGSWDEAAARTLLLALESADPGEAQAARTVLEAWARNAPEQVPLLLDVGFRWLRPETIEPLAEGLLGALDLACLEPGEVARRVAERGWSYRWQRLMVDALRGVGDGAGAVERAVRAAGDKPRAAWLLGLLG